MLADLAGSESSKRSSARYQRLEECKSINLSLSALGNCVAALANVCSNTLLANSGRPLHGDSQISLQHKSTRLPHEENV